MTVKDELTALAGIYREQVEAGSLSEYVRYAHKTIASSIAYIDKLHEALDIVDGYLDNGKQCLHDNCTCNVRCGICIREWAEGAARDGSR